MRGAVLAVVLSLVAVGCGEGPPVPSEITVGIAGIWHAPNTLQAPDGAMHLATNVEIPWPGVATPRRGLPPYTGGFSVSGTRARAVAFFEGSVIIHYGTTFARWDDDLSSWVSYSGSYSPPASDIPVTFVEARGSLYATTSKGIYVLDEPTGSWLPAGVPAALDFTAGVVGTAGSALPANSATGIRMHWSRIDGNGYLKRGAVSQREVVVNPAGQTAAIGGAVRAANVVTVTTPTAHGFAVGQVVSNALGGADANFSAGNKTVASTPTSTTFTYAEAGANGASAATHTYTPVTTDITITARIPDGITSTHFLEVYRTPDTVGATVDPGDAQQKVLEVIPTNVDLAAKSVTFTVVTPNTMLDELIYTAAGEDPKLEPPLAMRMAAYNDRLFFGDVAGFQNFTLHIIAIPSFSEVLQIGGINFAGDDPEDPPAGEWKIYTDGTYAQNIDRTARSLVRAINGKTGSTLHAIYISSGLDAPGKILIRRRAYDQTAFSLTLGGGGNIDAYFPRLTQRFAFGAGTGALTRAGSTVTVDFGTAEHGLVAGQTFILEAATTADPNFPVGTKTVASVPDATHVTYTEAGAAASNANAYLLYDRDKDSVRSTNERQEGAYAFSEAGDPDAVPGSNFDVDGDAEESVLGFAQVGDSLFVAKDDGLWRGRFIEGTNDFATENRDATLRGLSPGSFKTLDERAFLLTERGVVAIPEFGPIEEVGMPVETDLPETKSDTLRQYGFAVVQENTHTYMLWALFEDSGNPTIPTTAYVYNTTSKAWTKWDRRATAGATDPSDGRLYLALGDANKVAQELRGHTYASHHDGSFATSITAVSTSSVDPNGSYTVTVTLNALPTDWTLQVGDTLLQEDRAGSATAVSLGPKTVAIPWNTAYGEWAVDTVLVHRSYETNVQWLPFRGGNPGVEKTWKDAALLFRKGSFQGGKGVFLTEYEAAESADLISTIAGTSRLLEAGKEQPLLMDVPPAASSGQQLSLEFRVRNALAAWELQGAKINYTQTGPGK